MLTKRNRTKTGQVAGEETELVLWVESKWPTSQAKVESRKRLEAEGETGIKRSWRRKGVQTRCYQTDRWTRGKYDREERRKGGDMAQEEGRVAGRWR